MKSIEDLKILSQIKIEDPDYYSENYDYGFQSFEEIELGREFKTELMEPEEQSPIQSAELNDKCYKLVYCTKCKETSKYYSKVGTNCLTCQSVFTYKCGKCAKIFSSISSLNNHLNYCCGKKSRFYCKRCGKSYSSKSNLTTHLKRRCKKEKLKFSRKLSSNVKLLNCDLCNYNTNRKELFISHMQAKHSSETFECSTCKKSFCSQRNLKQHQLKCTKKVTLLNNFQSKHLMRPSLKYFFCDHCNGKFKNKQALAYHLQSKHSSETFDNHTRCKSEPMKKSIKLLNFTCDHCNYQIHRKDMLINHMQSKHSSEKFNCEMCGKKYKTQRSIYNHGKYHCKGVKNSSSQNPKLFSCDHCVYQCNQKFLLVNHIRSKHSNAISDCKRCGKSFNSQFKLNLHVEFSCRPSNNFKLLSCDQCDYKCTKKQLLLYHIQSNHMSMVLKCDKCEKIFKTQYTLYNHVKFNCRPRKNSSHNFYCDHCEFKSSQKINLVGHIQIKHSTETFVCDHCKRAYGNERSLYNHVRYNCKQIKKIYKSSNYSCSHCEFNCSLKQVLLDHIQSEHSTKNFKCDKCEKSFGTLNTLSIHKEYNCEMVNSFLEMKLFSCDHKELFASLTRLKYECSVCKKSFGDQYSLNQHVKICSPDLKYFSCDRCDYESVKKQRLKYHVQSKHSFEKYECDKCKRLYSTLQSLKFHAKFSCKFSLGIKFLHCEVCNYVTKRKELFISHMQSKHSPETFGCSYCRKLFSSQRNLGQHVKICSGASISN